ncbi:PKD domain-containing protein [Spongiimicrobium sp. 3-5]|uniref:PKD domain-containing protein n=1 Tax=Spongiimicrobium sp. 3-5 TaxID=3332596 RepID=UPI00397FA330
MKKTKFSHKVMAVFLTLTFLPSLVPVNFLFASNNGPTAPEASSFEPVDATDMVNLATGDLSYVLPLMNVPSPEGGYPLSLAYHAGIAMDQEATWTGLGWNVNPGAITRSVNGYPDDWNQGTFREYFYNKGTTYTDYSASIGFTSNGGASVGLNLAWGDSRSFGGSVSLGTGILNKTGNTVGNIGVSVGTSGFSLNGGTYIGNNGFGIGGSIGTNGIGLRGSYGFDRKLGTSGVFTNQNLNLGVSSSWSGDVSANASYSAGEGGKKSSLGVNFSSSGVGITGTVGKASVGLNTFSFSHSVSSNDYNVKQSGYNIPAFIPLPGGILSFSFGKQKTTVSLDNLEHNIVNGTLYFRNNRAALNQNSTNVRGTSDIYGISTSGTYNSNSNNGVYPNYDGYRVMGQGIAGSISPRHKKNGALIGFNKKVENSFPTVDYELRHELPTSGSSYATATDFTLLPDFQFDNDYTSNWLQTQKDFHGSSANSSSIFNYLTSTANASLSRRVTGRYVEYYTNAELAAGIGFNLGLLKAVSATPTYSGTAFESDGIGAFKVVAPDGKTYHYTIPVYNHEIVARQYGMDPQYTLEGDAFYEKRQLKKYATHWLLTAVTGPDFVDMNNNQRPDDSDYGYWVAFDYGKWSNGYIWYNPHGEEFELSGTNDEIKNYSWGRKEIYYLDKVITRTHTALFVKEERADGRGKQLTYHHRKDKNTAVSTFNLREQSLLRLKEILLVKNSDLGTISKNNTTNLSATPAVNTNYSITWFDTTADGGGTKNINCSRQSSVLDAKDANNWTLLKDKSSKVVSFSYDYSLASGAPYTSSTGRLTLKNVTFKGKGDNQLMPPYTFAYNNTNKPYVFADKDEWGYDKHDPDQWSLTDITMPTGGKIVVDYEEDTFASAIPQNLSFSTTRSLDVNNTFEVSSNVDFSNFGIGLNDDIPATHRKVTSCSDGATSSDPDSYTMDVYDGTAKVIQVINPQKIKLQLNGNPTSVSSISYGSECTAITFNNTYTRVSMSGDTFSTGTRVKSLTTTDGTNSYRTDYDYDIPGTNITSGIVSYIPFGPYADKEVPYGMELPAPIAMYSHVKTTAYGTDNTSLGNTQYVFKTLVEKSSLNTTFGDVLQIDKDEDNFNNSGAGASVSVSTINVKDNTACLGQLLSTASYNSYGQLLSKTINNYALPDNAPQGIVRESFQQYKILDYTSGSATDKWYVNSSSRTIYSSALLSTTVIQGGFTSTTYFDQHDQYTGQLLKTTTTQSDGTEFRTETIPAYTRYANMGSKITSTSYKNMLTQEAMNKTYIKDNGTYKLVGAGINTWSPSTYTASNGGGTSSVWRKHKTYTWDGSSDSNGFFTSFSGDYDNFNWSTTASSQPTDWKLTSQINAYDPFSMVLEVEDINGNKAATKMGDDDTKIIVTANAPLSEMYYSGAEYLDGDTFDDGIDDVGRTEDRAHTGRYAIKVTSDQGFKTTLSGHRAGKYKISVWASKDNYTNARVYDGNGLNSFNGEKIIAGDWVLLNHYVSLSSSNKTIYVRANTGTLYYDDFRIHPVQSSMNSYVYNEWDELTHIIGANNLATQYVYNEGGQLCSTYAEVVDQTGIVGGFKVIAKSKLQYKNGSIGTCSNLSGSIATDENVTSTACNVVFDIIGYGGVTTWNVNFGDGSSQNGTNNPPATLSHSYSSAGNKTITLTLNNEQSFTTNISVSAAYTFSNASCSNCSSKTIRLNGTPGDPIIYSATTGGSGAGFYGYATVNGVRSDLLNTGSSVSSVDAGVFPSVGYVDCSLSVSNDSGGFGNTILSIEKAGDCGTVTTSVNMQ